MDSRTSTKNEIRAARRTGAPAGPLDAFFSPRSVALIGASERPGSVGRALLENLRGFGGDVFLVNPAHSNVLGLPAFPRLSALPRAPDLVVIATPALTVARLVGECADAGVPAAVIISAGFRESGAEGARLGSEVLAAARRGGVRLIGPNCLGVMTPHSGLNATFASTMAKPGGIAFLSQSGALCSAVLDWSLRENVGFSGFVSVGSMIDVGWGDLITHFGDDPGTTGIICYMESVGDAHRFLAAAREVAAAKPIIVLKVGRTETAAKAAASHTGALTGSDAVLDAAFRRAGVLRVGSIGELFNLAELSAKQPRPRGPRLTIVTNAGGPGALATDMLVANGGKLAPLSDETRSELDRLLPPHWSRGNPIDLLGDADPARYACAVELVVQDETTDGVLVILTPQSMTDAAATAEALKAAAKLAEKPVLASWMGGAGVDPGKAVLNAAGIPTFDYPDTAARAFGLMWRHSDDLRLLREPPAPPVPGTHAAGRDIAAKLIRTAQKAERTLLTEIESKQLLAAYGIPVVETHAAFTEDEAVKRAEELGFPVVVKLLSETLTHKTDVGGVSLDLRDADAVRRAWSQIHNSVCEKTEARHFLGVTVQPMVKDGGYELIFGSSIDAQFGPVLLFGAGGVLLEVFKDTALGLPPLNAALARRLMEQTRVFAALRGVRGRKAADLDALSQLLVRFSELVVEQPWIAEIDINPLLVSPEQMLALDARIVLHPIGTSEELLPRPAIRPARLASRSEPDTAVEDG